jgi:PST family polysaccharide transporter
MILKNTFWLLSEKTVKIIIGLLISAWMARYLGPENIGIISFATAIGSILTTIAGLGVQNIIVKNLVEKKIKFNEIIGTSLLLVTVSGVAIYVILMAILFTNKLYELEYRNVLIIVSAIVIFKQGEILQYVYEAKIESKNVALIQMVSYIIISMARVIFIIKEFELKWFAVLILMEVVIVWLGMIILSIKNKILTKSLMVSKNYTKELIAKSIPLMIASLSSIIYMKIDQIMLGVLVNAEKLGQFTTATRLSELLYIFPVAAMASFYPLMVKVRSVDNEKYKFITLSLFKIAIYCSLILCICITIFSKEITLIVYGEQYSESSEILQIHVWTLLFVSIGVVSHSWYINENLFKVIMTRTFIGAVVNILLNLILIPKYNGYGAAIASLIAQFMVALIVDLFNKETRKLFIVKIKAINPKGIINSYKVLIK